MKRKAGQRLATADFSDPASSLSQSNQRTGAADLRFAATEGQHTGCNDSCSAWREKVSKCLANILETTKLVSPEGSYHESMDYMRITWACLTLLAELQRTTTGIDPAHHYSVFANIGNTYLYKLLPDGTPSREGDNEYPILDLRDTAVLGYAVNRFKDPYSACAAKECILFRTMWLFRCRISLG
jgi:hypothetical protein